MIGKQLKNMFGIDNTVFCNANTIYQISNYYVLFLMCIIFAVPVWKKISGFFKEKRENLFYGLESAYLMCIFLLSVAYIVDASYNPFLYFRF